MDEIKAIELLREVLLGESKTELPKNGVQKEKEEQKRIPAVVPEQTTTQSVQKEREEQKRMPAVVPEQTTTQSGAVATCAGQDQGCLPSTEQKSTETWARIDPVAKAFVTTKRGGPK